MKPNFKILGTTAALAILVLGFQNCSPVNFGAGNEFAQKSAVPAGESDDDLDADLPQDDSDDVDDNDDVAEHDPSSPDHDDHDKKDCPNKGPDKESADKYRAICKESKIKGFLSMSANANIIGNNGSGRFKAPSLNKVSGNNGAVALKHDGTGAGTIKEIASNNGHTIICGFDVENISSLNGSVVIVGGHVDNISANNGSITLVDSSIGSAVGNNGSINVRELK